MNDSYTAPTSPVIAEKHHTVLDIVKTLRFSYPGNEQVAYEIPSSINFLPGCIYGITGISGSGKSTILTLLAALRRFSEGALSYSLHRNMPVHLTTTNWRAQTGPRLWRSIGFSFQRPQLLHSLTVRQNLALSPYATYAESSDLFPDAGEWAYLQGIRPTRASGGQIQRLSILRAFSQDQNLVFLDEPTNNLDRDNREMVAEFLRARRKNRSIVVVSHEQEFLDLLDIDVTFRIEVKTGDSGQDRRCLIRT